SCATLARTTTCSPARSPPSGAAARVSRERSGRGTGNAPAPVAVGRGGWSAGREPRLRRGLGAGMSCTRYRRVVFLWIDREREALPVEPLARHLQECPECHDHAERVERLLTLMRTRCRRA